MDLWASYNNKVLTTKQIPKAIKDWSNHWTFDRAKPDIAHTWANLLETNPKDEDEDSASVHELLTTLNSWGEDQTHQCHL